MKNCTVHSVIRTLEKQGNCYFTYNTKEVDVNRKVSITANNSSIEDILNQLFYNQNIDYSIEKNHIVLFKKSVNQINQKVQEVKGVVVDGQNEPIIGASILEVGTTNGTVTDIDGKFALKLTGKSAKITISYVGFMPQTIKVDGQSDIRIVLKEDTKSLDEVVVIGYGTQKKSSVSGSVTTVSGEKISQIPTSSAEAALQGMAPGLSVNFGSGSAGSSPSLQVRGVTSWGTSNAPLVIIDGVPGDMSYLNPEDIKSMSVLKDAATAAIYGARAAAGVILIETNRGKTQGAKINFSAYWGMDDLPKKMEICNSEEFVKVRKMALQNAGIAEDRWPRYIKEFEKDPSQFANTDWQDEYYRRGLTQKYNVGYTSGNEFSNIAFSAFYSKSDAIVENTGDKKYGFRLNSDVVRGKFKVGESVSYSCWNADLETNSGFPSMYQITNIEPLVFVHDENNEGGYGGAIAGMGMSDAANMVGLNNLVENRSFSDYISASGYLKYEPIKDLAIKLQVSRNIYYGKSRYFVPTYQLGVMNVNNRASLDEDRSKTMNDLIELTANWSKDFKDHSLQVLLGLSQEERKYEYLSAGGKKFDNNDLRELGLAQEDFTVGGMKTRSGLRSLFGRVNYSYKLRYMLMASFRYDGSSRFADGNKWGFFPSVSVGWNIGNEPFWQKYKDLVSTFKLRMSYGGLGNQSIGLYKYLPILTSNTNALNYPLNGKDVSLGYAITELASKNIKWETTLYKNIGIDLSFWNNKLEMSLEGYIKDTKDMLSTKNISLCTGFGPLTVNDGKLRTTGFELQTTYHGNVNKFRYDLDLNLSHYRSVLKSMADPNYLYESGAIRTYVGGQIGEFWAYKTAGIFQSEKDVSEWNAKHGYKDAKGEWHPMQPSAKPGDIKFVDQNGDGMLDSGDKIKFGVGTPKISLAFNVNLYYKNFDLIANFYGDFGVKRYNYTKYQLQRMDQVFNYGKDALKAWTPQNTNTDVPRAVQGDPNGNNVASDRFIENGDYLRLNNLQLGYNLSKNICNHLGLTNLRLYVGGQRLFTLTKYKGYDPSTGDTVGQIGYDYAATPLSRLYMVGLKLGF